MPDFYENIFVKTVENERLAMADIAKDTIVRDLKKAIARTTGMTAQGWSTFELHFLGGPLKNGNLF